VTAPAPGEVTALLQLWSEGSEVAREQLIPLVYRELRRRAGLVLRRERCDQTLQPTALVHEAYQTLVAQRQVRWQGRAHFFAVAATLMRRVLVDHARRRRALRRGGRQERISIDGTLPGARGPDPLEVLAVDEALAELAALDPLQARIVELRFFGGLGIEEIALVVGVSRATVNRDWAMARAWLRRRLSDPEGGP
jgi:RNA polymerase sigma factor (TIGR02999 family)